MRAFDALEFGRPKRHSPPIRGAVRGSVGRTVRLGAHRRRWTLLCVLAYCIDTPIRHVRQSRRALEHHHRLFSGEREGRSNSDC